MDSNKTCIFGNKSFKMVLNVISTYRATSKLLKNRLEII